MTTNTDYRTSTDPRAERGSAGPLIQAVQPLDKAGEGRAVLTIQGNSSSVAQGLRSADDLSAPGNPLDRLAAVVLLAGSVRSNHWATQLGCSVLDLPIEQGRTLLGHWHSQTADLAVARAIARLPLRILLDHLAPAPQLPAESSPAVVLVERDRFDFRGSGGVLHDVASDYADDQYILVANAACLLSDTLDNLAHALAGPAADICIHALPNGRPSGLMLLRCGSLRDIAAVGYIDMKEQALPHIARRHSVRVVRMEAEVRAIRSAKDYLRALLREHQRRSGQTPSAFAEDWKPTYLIVQRNEDVHGTAVVHDSVVLAGGRVEAQAVVVRSIVCAGGVVRRGQTVVDDVVAPAARR